MKATYIDHMGSDLSVANAARVSFDKESTWKEEDNHCKCHAYYPGECCCEGVLWGEDVGTLRDGDVKLIKYLANYSHWTPFSQTAISFRMKAPIPIRTQCFKHKVGFSENEVSRRYVDDTPEFYTPDWRRKPTDGAKQGSSGRMPEVEICRGAGDYDTYMENCIYYYEKLLETGVCPEQARFVLPQGVMTEWIWTGSVAAYARFCKQRLDPHAQKEIQELAQMVSNIIEPIYPISWKALMESK